MERRGIGIDVVTDTHSGDAPRGALAARLGEKSATIAVVGMGYVGVPLAHAFVKAGYRTVGLDNDSERIRDLQLGRPYIGHLDESVFHRLAANSGFEATTEPEALHEADAILICVPTPLDGDHAPDLSQIVSAAAAIAEHGRLDQLVVLESTTYPGTTRDVLLPALLQPPAPGTAAGETPFIAYSPERIDPGGTSDLTSIAKLIAGIDEESTQLAELLYGNVFAEVHIVKDVETAEAAKLLENTFRAVNIALVNELKVSLTSQGIDIWDVIEAASSKPFGFMPFFPGPGVGGHCIPVDPTYLAWKSHGKETRLALTETAIRINEAMPQYVVDELSRALGTQDKLLADSDILIVGISYKRGTSDVRESPALALWAELVRRGVESSFHDPLVDTVEVAGTQRSSVSWDAEGLASFDAAVICTDHDGIDYSLLAASRILVVDTRNAMARRGLGGSETIVKA